MLGKKPVKKAAKKAAPKPKKPVEAVNKPKRVGVKNLQPNEPLALEPGLHAAEETTPGEAKRAARKVGRDQKKEAEKQAKEAAKLEAKEHKEHEKHVKDLLKDVKPKDLVFTGTLDLEKPDPGDRLRAMPKVGGIDTWVASALAMLGRALKEMGIDIVKLAEEAGDELLHKLIELTEATKPSWQRFVILGALEWIHKKAHAKDALPLLTAGNE
jgi:hypothetical protein